MLKTSSAEGMHACLFMDDESAKRLCFIFTPHVVPLTHKFLMWENFTHALPIARETQASFHPVCRVLSMCSQKSCWVFWRGISGVSFFLRLPGHAGKQLDVLVSPPNHVWTKPCTTKAMGRGSENTEERKWEAKALGDGMSSGLDPIQISFIVDQNHWLCSHGPNSTGALGTFMACQTAVWGGECCLARADEGRLHGLLCKPFLKLLSVGILGKVRAR